METQFNDHHSTNGAGTSRFSKIAHSSKSVEWWTPHPFLDKLTAAIQRSFDLDPCSPGADLSRVPALRHYTEADDGLRQPWMGWVFCNPPYARSITDKWLARCHQAVSDGEAEVVFALVPARTETSYWRDSVVGFADVLFLEGRLKFGDGKDSAPFPSVLIIWGGDDNLVNAVRKAFPGAGWINRNQAAPMM